ncbi:MAG: Trk system potassium transporter TrkA [Legionellales bacterium]|nr:MAG: Trk system potassium transporter TrkA [Legionellales bacterium]
MKIIILGAGKVGTTIAQHFALEQHDITVVDHDSRQLAALTERLDIRTVTGDASMPSSLLASGIVDADLLIAVTRSDTTNLIACQIAATFDKVAIKIARLRSKEYLDRPEIFKDYVDVAISPEKLITNYISSLIKHPEALQILQFANNALQLVVVKANSKGVLINSSIGKVPRIMPQVQMQIVAIYRNNMALKLTCDTIINSDDEVFFLTEPKHVNTIITKLKTREYPSRNIIIAGSGNIGSELAATLDSKYNVKVIGRNLANIKQTALKLSNGIALHGDAADKNLLLEENIHNTDVFCAVTNSDEANIMSAMLAKRLGAKKVMSLINRPAYLEVVTDTNIDAIISPQQITISSILTHVRHGDIVNAYTLRQGFAEAIEIVVHGNSETSRVIGKTIQDIALPKNTIIGAIVRRQQIFMGQNDVEIQAKDHVILLVTDKASITAVEQLFQNASP